MDTQDREAMRQSVAQNDMAKALAALTSWLPGIADNLKRQADAQERVAAALTALETWAKEHEKEASALLKEAVKAARRMG